MLENLIPALDASRYHPNLSRRLTLNDQQRRGAATIEFAVCMPVLILLVFGAIEASSFIFLKQSLNVAAYEGVREAIRNDSDSADGLRVANAILSSRQVRGFGVRFPSEATANSQRGQAVTIEVSAPTERNSPLAGKFVNGRTLTARVTMMKE